MGDAPLMLGVSGLRGIVGESLTPELATRYAKAFGRWLNERTENAEPAPEPGLAFQRWSELRATPRVVIGRDGRAGGDEIARAAIAGLVSAGCDVIDLGVQMTPTVGVMADQTRADGAMIVTASHNPQQWNGLKCLFRGRRNEDAPRASAPSAQDAQEIISSFQTEKQEQPGLEGRHADTDDALACHLSRLGSALQRCQLGGLDGLAKGKAVVVDSVNSSGVLPTRKLMAQSGADLASHVGGEQTGIFPHTPEPTAENLSGEGGLCDAVPGLNADVGFAQDPDGDRLAIVDESGRYIGEEYTFVLCAMSLLEARKSRGGEDAKSSEEKPSQSERDVVFCTNLSTSRMIDDVAALYGARVVRTPVGEANVVEAMMNLKREGKDVILGGEGNGGVIWPEVTYVRDSLSSMALVLSLMARRGKTVSKLVADVPTYAIVKRKQPLARKEDATPTVEKLAAHYAGLGEHVRVDTQDGVRIDFDDDRAWVHVRASNTEPILRLIAEAPTDDRAQTILDEVQALVDAG